MYFLLSEDVVELVLLCCDVEMPVSGLEMCNILSMSAVFDLKTAPPMLVMLGVYGAAVLLDVSWLLLDLVTCRSSLEVVNDTL